VAGGRQGPGGGGQPTVGERQASALGGGQAVAGGHAALSGLRPDTWPRWPGPAACLCGPTARRRRRPAGQRWRRHWRRGRRCVAGSRRSCGGWTLRAWSTAPWTGPGPGSRAAPGPGDTGLVTVSPTWPRTSARSPLVPASRYPDATAGAALPGAADRWHYRTQGSQGRPWR
jgi:hypothetical protein